MFHMRLSIGSDNHYSLTYKIQWIFVVSAQLKTQLLFQTKVNKFVWLFSLPPLARLDSSTSTDYCHASWLPCCPSSSLSCGLAPRFPSYWSAQYQPLRVTIPATRISIKFGFLMSRPTSWQLWTFWTCSGNLHAPPGEVSKRHCSDVEVMENCVFTHSDKVLSYFCWYGETLHHAYK